MSIGHSCTHEMDRLPLTISSVDDRTAMANGLQRLDTEV